MGVIVIYGALFSKLWMVNKVLQFRRAKILKRRVVWPFALMVVTALLVLSLWTGLDPLEWVRVETNEDSGESVGQCNCENLAAYITPLALVTVIPMLLTGLMAWKTKDVDHAFSESTWIFALFLVQLEVRFKRDRFFLVRPIAFSLWWLVFCTLYRWCLFPRQ